MAKHVLIIGGGPAGCSAAMTLRLRGEDVTILYSGEGALGRAKRVDNYPGLAQMPGGEMLSAFRRQAEEMGAALRPGVARYIQRTRRGFTVLAGEDMIACDAVLLASGVARVNLIPGEEALVGRGVSYCATCDGMLYRDRPVAAVVLGAGFDEDVRFLQGICQVDVLTRPPRALRAEGERVILSTADSDTAYDCVFILRPAVALTTLLPALETAGRRRPRGRGHANQYSRRFRRGGYHRRALSGRPRRGAGQHCRAEHCAVPAPGRRDQSRIY